MRKQNVWDSQSKNSKKTKSFGGSKMKRAPYHKMLYPIHNTKDVLKYVDSNELKVRSVWPPPKCIQQDHSASVVLYLDLLYRVVQPLDTSHLATSSLALSVPQSKQKIAPILFVTETARPHSCTPRQLFTPYPFKVTCTHPRCAHHWEVLMQLSSGINK